MRARRLGSTVKGLLAGALISAATWPAPVEAQPPSDPKSIVTLDLENDAVAGTDRYYTAGQRLNYVGPTGDVPGWVSNIGRTLWGDGLQRLSIGVTQSIFTPSNTQINPPNPNDRPYAAELTGNFALIQDTDDWRSVVGIDLGVVGPGALGEEVQNGFHHLIGDTPNRGWGYQIHNEPLIELLSERTYRVPTGSVYGIETDLLPELTAGVGNERVYAQTGIQARIGQGLASDYGAARIRPGLTGTDAYTPTRPFVWYLFAGVDGQAVAHDITLDGNTFESSRHVSRQPFVGEFQAGLSLILYGVKASYTEVLQTQEFHNQHGGIFNFGVFTLSTRF